MTGDLGVDKDGNMGSNFQPGIEIHAKYTLFAEGCRGHLGKKLMNKFNSERMFNIKHMVLV